MFKSFDPKILEIHDKHDDCIHPCTTRPPNTNENTFHVLFNNDVCKLMNVCNHLVCNPTCYKLDIDASKKLCKYGFPQPLINKTHFDNHTELLHIKRIDKWINNANPWILLTFTCNHDLNIHLHYTCIIFYKLQYKKLKQSIIIQIHMIWLKIFVIYS